MRFSKKVKFVGFILVTFFLISTIFGFLIFDGNINLNGKTSESFDKKNNNLMISTSNLDILQNVFDAKNDQFTNFDYFSEIYESSLQATYYALYILDSIGSLSQIDEQKITDFIMSHYDFNSGLFSDKLSNRYLDTTSLDLSLPWSSLLEVNLYALLSLDILGKLSQINSSEFINFIWSCYDSTSKGFIGQPYYSGLDSHFKVSTAEKTYFAVITLDMLLNQDWSLYTTEIDELILSVSDLQIDMGSSFLFGGFHNDVDINYNSLHFSEPNLFSAFYNIKTLQIFGAEQTLNLDNFKIWLDEVYYDTDFYFRLTGLDFNLNQSNIVATSMGLELSKILFDADITNKMYGNKTNIINFLINNRNVLGGWDGSTTLKIHELIDTFQIIRSMSQIGELYKLTPTSGLISYIDLFFNIDGYSLLSEDYTSIDTLHTIVSSNYEYDTITNLEIQKIYSYVNDAFEYNDFPILHTGFRGYIGKLQGQFDSNGTYKGFRSYPLEYYFGWGSHTNLDEIGFVMSTKTTFKALDLLNKLYKLDDFAVSNDLNDIVVSIIDSQFLDIGFNRFGGFLPYNLQKHYWDSEVLNEHVYLEYAFYAIKIFELLGNFLSLGNITSIGFDADALYTYINNNIVETSTHAYFKSIYSNNVEKSIQDTYYMTYILKSIGKYNLTDQKIKKYVEDNIDYSNIMNIYYSFKIAETLNLDIQFDVDQTHQLIQQIYSPGLNEFYETNNKMSINQDIFYWLVYMAKHDEVRIDINYGETAMLGTSNKINVSLCNLILESFSSYTVVKFESALFGSIPLTEGINNTYEIEIYIPVNTDYYPTIDGIIRVYDVNNIIAELPISIDTYYNINKELTFLNISRGIKYEIDMSLTFGDGQTQPAYNSDVYMFVYRDGTYLKTEYFTRDDFLDYSTFKVEYQFDGYGQYYFGVYLQDYIDDNPITISNNSYLYESGDPNEPSNSGNEINLTAIPIVLGLVSVSSGVIIYSVKKKPKIISKFK